MRLALALVLIAAAAHAGPRRNALSWGAGIHIHRLADANQVEVGGGASAGWHALADVHLRCHFTDRWSMAARERLDGNGVRAGELELARVLASHRLADASYSPVRADVIVDAGGGAEDAGPLRGLAFAGWRLRFEISGVPRIAIDLGARESWVPLGPTTRGFATEVMTSVAMACPIDRRTCWPF